MYSHDYDSHDYDSRLWLVDRICFTLTIMTHDYDSHDYDSHDYNSHGSHDIVYQ